VLTSEEPPEKRETWFEKKMQERVQVTISHLKIIETGLDLLSHPTLIFYESGYSLHTLRQASRRSWRIGQCQPVRVDHLHYEDTFKRLVCGWIPAVVRGPEPIESPPSDLSTIPVPIEEVQTPSPSLLIFGSRPSAGRLPRRQRRPHLSTSRDQLLLF